MKPRRHWSRNPDVSTVILAPLTFKFNSFHMKRLKNGLVKTVAVTDPCISASPGGRIHFIRYENLTVIVMRRWRYNADVTENDRI